MDQFLVKFMPRWPHHLGNALRGSGEDIEADVAPGRRGNAYLAGRTRAPRPSAAGPHQPVYNGDDDLYLVKFTPPGFGSGAT